MLEAGTRQGSEHGARGVEGQGVEAQGAGGAPGARRGEQGARHEARSAGRGPRSSNIPFRVRIDRSWYESTNPGVDSGSGLVGSQ